MKDRKSLLVSRFRISKKERRALVAKLREELGERAAALIEGEEDVEIARLRHPKIEEIVLVRGVPAYFYYEGEVYPSLLLLYRLGYDPGLPRVYVDAGAVPHILNGADVMVPGITRVEGDFGEGEKLFVADEEKKRVFAVGKALMSSETIREAGRGKAVLNVHYAGDELWKIMNQVF